MTSAKTSDFFTPSPLCHYQIPSFRRLLGTPFPPTPTQCRRHLCGIAPILSTLTTFIVSNWHCTPGYISCRYPSFVPTIISNSGSSCPREGRHFIHHEQFRPKSPQPMQLKKWFKTISRRLVQWAAAQTFRCRDGHHRKRGR